MSKDPAYAVETRERTRNLGLVTSVILAPMLCAFIFIDRVSPDLWGILGWRIGGLVPALLFIAGALFVFRKIPRLTVPFHAAQLAGLMVMMCGITTVLFLRPGFPSFGRGALISSLLVCIFADFVFAAGARRFLFAILIPPLAGMAAAVVTAGSLLSQTEKLWLISNPSALAIGLSFFAMYQERTSRREFRTRRELGRTEVSLRESEKKFHDLFDNAEVGMFRGSLDGSVLIDVNPRFLELTGRSREELIAAPSALHWAGPAERGEMMTLLARDGRVTNYECRMVNGRGEERSCLASLRIFPEQKILEGTLVDITERRQAEEWRQVLQHSIDAAADGAFWLKEDGSFFYVNESACRGLGYTREELMALGVKDVNPEATPAVWAEVWRLLAEKKSLDTQSTHRRKDGSTFPVQITTSFIRSGDREFAVGFARDITEHKRLEAEREAVLQRLEFVVATTHTGMDIIDENHLVRYVDPARRRTMGDPSGRLCYEYFFGLSSPCVYCAMRDAIATKTVQVHEQALAGRIERYAQVTAQPYQDEAGTWLVAEVVVDITERRQAETERLDLERRIAASQKLEGLGILAGGVAHNFNNLLTVILGHAELLKETARGDDAAAASVLEIIKAGSRSRDLVSQLLTLGRRQPLQMRSLDLNAVVRECSTMLRHALRENITVEYRLSGTPCPVTADGGRIEEVLLNLALNAQDAIPREGHLEIATMEVTMEGAPERRPDSIPPGRYIVLTVSDTGQGIDGDTVKKIFDPFFTTKEPGKGTGLGLSSVYGIVKQHSGTIEVESRPGVGTRFQISLPRAGVPAVESASTEAPRAAAGVETVLLVEDEAPIRAMLSRHLRAQGYTVLEADDGVSALGISTREGARPHILVTDVVMPRMNGTDLRDRLRERLPDLKVLFMSGYAREVIDSHLEQDGEMDLIVKPFTGQALALRLREVLDRKSTARP